MKYFENKKVLVIVPHQDDEINIAGGLLATITKYNNKVYVLYSTNGDYSYSARTRVSECIKSCKTLGINEKDIFFLGYSDQYSSGNNHLYNTDDKWISRKGKFQTYLTKEKNEVSYIFEKKHHIFNKENFIYDIQMLIEKILPDVIICIDFDSHCDHRATSLATELAIGKILNSNKKCYHPFVYKAFAYPTSYFGEEDFNCLNIKSTKFRVENYSFSDLENPYYDYDKRIRFPIDKACLNRNLCKNKIFKSLLCHNSQIIIKKAFSIINGDQIFWQRRTDNLLYDSNVVVSSGDKTKLYDFMLFNCSNILKGNSQIPILDDYSWKPKDKKPFIKIEFEEKKDITLLKIYNSVTSNRKVSFELYVDGNLYNNYDFEESIINEIYFDKTIKCKKIELFFDNKNGDISISELELFDKLQDNFSFVKFVDMNDDFIYNYYIDKNFSFKIYGYDNFDSKYISLSNFNFYVNNKLVSSDDITFEKLPRKFVLKAELKSDNSVYDIVKLKKINKLCIIMNFMVAFNNNMYLKYKILNQKLQRKIIKLLKKQV